MASENVEISVKGRSISVSGIRVGERTIIAPPGWLRIAEIKDEAWLEDDAAADPEACIAGLRQSDLRVDLFTFSQKPPELTPKYPYFLEWDNVAGIPTGDLAEWWNHRVPQETRKNVRRAAKRGIVVREVELSESLLRGIVGINNESPVRQGRRFWHYGKSLAEVEREYTTLCEQSAYLEHVSRRCAREVDRRQWQPLPEEPGQDSVEGQENDFVGGISIPFQALRFAQNNVDAFPIYRKNRLDAMKSHIECLGEDLRAFDQ